MNSVKVRNLVIGEGIPKICVPIVGTTREEIIQAAERVKESSVDIVEWRADWFEGIGEQSCVNTILDEIREILGEIPLLFTFRTSKEGGEREIYAEDYIKLNRMMAESGKVDMVDIQMFWEELPVKELIEVLHKAGVKVIGSYHDFSKTPEKDELVFRLRKMQDLGADIPKIAVMPNSKRDVLTLLMATNEMAEEYADRPIITMSMSGDGLISRLCGETFGSAVTFGAMGKVSAPGQLEVETLRNILECIYEGRYFI